MRIRSLRDCLGNASCSAGCHLRGARGSVWLGELLGATCLGGRGAQLAGRSILLRTHNPLTAALAMVELDGVAQRLVICPPDVASQHVPSIIAKAGVDVLVSDGERGEKGAGGLTPRVHAGASLSPCGPAALSPVATQWVLLTSGTTGEPKMLLHDLAGLTGAIKPGQLDGPDVVWGTFYDIRRYGGLQIFLRALLGNRPLVLPDPAESPTDHLVRLGAHGVTHLTGTPSHWRRALMNPAVRAIAPRYIRLSGEIADQAILDALRSVFPAAAIGHAYASTEGGVSFEVTDGREGFPADLFGRKGEVEMKVENGSLRIRSSRTARGYLGEPESVLADNDGFVDTADIVQQRGDRYYFLGRRSGIINVGGLKVHPEEVEARINGHPAVLMSCVRSQRNPITGALVVADIVLKERESCGNGKGRELEQEILSHCRKALPRHKVPAALRFVKALGLTETGKMGRPHA